MAPAITSIKRITTQLRGCCTRFQFIGLGHSILCLPRSPPLLDKTQKCEANCSHQNDGQPVSCIPRQDFFIHGFNPLFTLREKTAPELSECRLFGGDGGKLL